MIIDIGEGVTDCAITQSSRIQETCSIRVGCAAMRQAIRFAFRKQDAMVSDEDSERHLRNCGVSQAGLDNFSDNRRKIVSAVESVAVRITETIDSFLRALPHTMGCEIIESGIWLTGGGALVPGMRGSIEQKTGITVRCVANPCSAVVEGARAILPVVSALNQWR
jgi:rod shape-determining protein MreB